MTASRRSRTPLLIVFLDLDGYKVECAKRDDMDVADLIDDYYDRVTSAVNGAGGRVVKFIGDGALVIFPERAIDAGARALVDLIPRTDAFMADRGWNCQLRAKVHFGEVMAGEFGSTGGARFDVMGRTVNAAAMMTPARLAISPEVMAKLSPAAARRVDDFVQAATVRAPG